MHCQLSGGHSLNKLTQVDLLGPNIAPAGYEIDTAY